MSPVVGFFDHHRVAVAVLYLFLLPAAILCATVWENSRLDKIADQGKRAHDSLCRRDKQDRDRIRQSKLFLQKHPRGIPQLGLTRTLIERGIQRDESALKADDALRC